MSLMLTLPFCLFSHQLLLTLSDSFPLEEKESPTRPPLLRKEESEVSLIPIITKTSHSLFDFHTFFRFWPV
jgi:hypothetical protein